MKTNNQIKEIEIKKKMLNKARDLIVFKISFVEDKCTGKERSYRYYELANLRDWLDDELELLK